MSRYAVARSLPGTLDIPRSRRAAPARAPRTGTARRGAALPIAPIAPLAVLALAFVLLATVGPRAPRHFTSLIAQRTLSTSGDYPAVGGTSVSFGTWRGAPFDNGTLIDRSTVTGQPAAATFTFKGTEVGSLGRSTWRSSFTGTATRRSNGSLVIVRRGRITGGTGIYGAATGSYAFTGSTSNGSELSRGRLSGTVSY